MQEEWKRALVSTSWVSAAGARPVFPSLVTEVCVSAHLYKRSELGRGINCTSHGPGLVKALMQLGALLWSLSPGIQLKRPPQALEKKEQPLSALERGTELVCDGAGHAGKPWISSWQLLCPLSVPLLLAALSCNRHSRFVTAQNLVSKLLLQALGAACPGPSKLSPGRLCQCQDMMATETQDRFLELGSGGPAGSHLCALCHLILCSRGQSCRAGMEHLELTSACTEPPQLWEALGVAS